MSRSSPGFWGATLDDAGFGRALAALGGLVELVLTAHRGCQRQGISVQSACKVQGAVYNTHKLPITLRIQRTLPSTHRQRCAVLNSEQQTKSPGRGQEATPRRLLQTSQGPAATRTAAVLFRVRQIPGTRY